MASEKSNVLETVNRIALVDIFRDDTWNSRSGDYTKSEGGTEKSGEKLGDSFSALVADVKQNGIQEPVVIRPTPKDSKHKQPYMLVEGFRRCKAALQAGLDCVPARIRNLSEVEARFANIRENTARENLKSADLAWSISELARLDPSLTDSAIALQICRSQAYVSKLHSIMKLPKDIVGAWRHGSVFTMTDGTKKAATGEISVKQMYELCALKDNELQKKAFEGLVNKTVGDKSDGKAAGKKGWYHALKAKTESLGNTLGILHRLGGIPKIDITDDVWCIGDDEVPAYIDSVFNVNSKIVSRERKGLQKALVKGFEAGMVEPEIETENEDD